MIAGRRQTPVQSCTRWTSRSSSTRRPRRRSRRRSAASGLAPPRVELPALSPLELRALAWEGAPELEDQEGVLAFAARARGAFDVSLAEGLARLCQGERREALASHLDDWAREGLDLGRSTALGLARLGRELRSRPHLREALRAGRVKLRAAQTVLSVAVGAAEAEWVELAAQLTVRALEEAVRRAGTAPPEADDEEWLRLHVPLAPDDRAVVDEALALAGEAMPGTSRMERLEAIAQEFLAEVYADPDEDERRRLWPAFRAVGQRGNDHLERRAALEAETERWCALARVADRPAPDVRFDETMTADEVAAKLRELAALRSGWDDYVGYCAYVVKESGLHLLAGFVNFRHYLEEQVGLPARAIEQRVALEERVASSPALQEARLQKVRYQKLRLLARLRERDIGAWIPRAKAMTCVELERAVDQERERQMRGRRKLSVPMPRRIAVVLAAAIAAVRERSGRPLSAGRCLAVIAWHFLDTWEPLVTPRKTRSRTVRERDGGHCQVPGCSRP